LLYLLAASLLWAFSFGLIKQQLADIDPVLVAFLRLAISALVFLPPLVRWRLPARLVRTALALGAVQFGLMYVFYLASYRYLPAYGVALLTIFTPLYVVLLDDLRRRRVSGRHAVAALLAVAGAAVVVVRGTVAPQMWPGVVLLQAANLCFAAGQLKYRELAAAAASAPPSVAANLSTVAAVSVPRAATAEQSLSAAGPGRSEVALLGWMYLGAALVTGAGAVLTSGSLTLGASDTLTEFDRTAWLVIVYLGLLPTAVGFYLWNKGAARTDTGILAVSNNLKIPLAVLVSWFVFGESADYVRVLLGLAIITAALWLAGARDRERSSRTKGD